MKKDGDARDVADDIQKIKDYWFTYPLSYRFGAVINISSGGHGEVEVFKKEI